MNKTKRLVCLALAVCMLFGVILAGCGTAKEEPAATDGGNVTTAGTTAAAGETSAAPEAPKLDPYELNCYFLAPQVKDLPLVQEEVNKLLKEKINATIKLNYFWWDSYQDKQKLIVASGEKVDTMFSPSWWGYNTFVAQKAWLELDDLLQQYGKDIIANINPAYLKAPIINGKLYGIPTSKDMFGNGGVLVNKALADKYGFDFSNVKEPKDFEPMLQTIRKRNPALYRSFQQKAITQHISHRTFMNISARLKYL